MRFTRVATTLVIVHSVLFLALFLWARSVAVSAKGGISPSEALEGVIPGGLLVLVVVWIVLVTLAAGAWGWHLSKPVRGGSLVSNENEKYHKFKWLVRTQDVELVSKL